MLFVVVLSVSACFATSDDSAIQEATDEVNLDEISIDEQDEISANEVDEPAEEASDDVVLAVDEPAVVTKDNFSNYFDDYGTLKDTVTDKELVFEGEFSNTTDLHYLTISKPIKLTGKNAVLNNISIIIDSDNVTIDSFTINTYDATNAIYIRGPSENVTLIGNKINFVGIDKDNDAVGIYADSVDNLKIIANVVTFKGNGNETGNKALELDDCDGAVIDGNTFDITAPSSGYMKGIIDLGFGRDLQFTKNNVVIVGIPTDYTINGICFNGDNVTIDDNNITISGSTYTYGIGAYGGNSKVTNNKVTVSSDIYYACGIDLEGYSLTTVDKNEFNISSTGSAYGIYSGMTSGGLIGIYTNNIINAKSYFVVGVELGSIDENVIGNIINVEGNYTVGVGAVTCSAWAPNPEDPTGPWIPSAIPITNRLVQDNTITSTGSNVGNTTSGDAIPIITTGVYAIAGNITITKNKITTNGDYSIIILDNASKSSISNNELFAKSLSGDQSVKASGNVTVSDNKGKETPVQPSQPAQQSTPVAKKNVKITAKKKTFKAKTKVKKYTVTLKVGKKALKKVKVYLKVKGKTYKATTNAKGKATFKIKNLKKKGKYTAVITYKGSSLYNKATKKVKLTVKK